MLNDILFNSFASVGSSISIENSLRIDIFSHLSFYFVAFITLLLLEVSSLNDLIFHALIVESEKKKRSIRYLIIH